MIQHVMRYCRVFKHYLYINRCRRRCVIGSKVIVSKLAIIGNGCRIGDNSVIAKDVIIGANAIIGKGAILERITVGENSEVDGRIVITGHGDGTIIVGHDSYIGPYTALDFSDNLEIGNYVHIAGLSTGLWTHSSALMCLNSIGVKEKSETHRPTKPITIDSNVYIGGNCTIYPGVSIGHHSIVAPNSAVTKDVPPYSMVGGVPARMIKSLDGYKKL